MTLKFFLFAMVASKALMLIATAGSCFSHWSYVVFHAQEQKAGRGCVRFAGTRQSCSTVALEQPSHRDGVTAQAGRPRFEQRVYFGL